MQILQTLLLFGNHSTTITPSSAGIELLSPDQVTSVIDRWLAAVVKTDARLLATVRLSSLVSCSTRWYLRSARPRESAAQRRAPLMTVLTVVVLPSVAAQPRHSRDSPSSPGAYDGSPQTPSPLPSPAPRGPAPTCRNALASTHEVWTWDWTFAVAYRTWISQSRRSSSFRICSLSCFMSLDLSMVLEFTLKMEAHILNTQSGTFPPS